MVTDQQANPFAQHYLEITALDPSPVSAGETPLVPNPSLVVTWPLIIFFALFIGSFTFLFFKRMKHLRSVFMIFIFAFLLGALPLAMQSISKPISTGIAASPDITPTNVIVSAVTPEGFVISWSTSQPTTGALKIGTSSDMQGSAIYQDYPAKTDHRLVVLNLQPGSTSYLQILSNTVWFDHQGLPIQVTLPSE
jgi:hypothetical protein